MTKGPQCDESRCADFASDSDEIPCFKAALGFEIMLGVGEGRITFEWRRWSIHKQASTLFSLPEEPPMLESDHHIYMRMPFFRIVAFPPYTQLSERTQEYCIVC